MGKSKNNSQEIKIGKWTKLEVQKFVGGLYKHGRNWIKIQKMIKTRSIGQVRSYAQKYFAKMLPNDKVFLGQQIRERSKLMLTYGKSQKIQTQVENSSQNQKPSSNIEKQCLKNIMPEDQCPIQLVKQENCENLIAHSLIDDQAIKIQKNIPNQSSISSYQEYPACQNLQNTAFSGGANINYSGYPLYYIFYPNFYLPQNCP